MNECSNIAVKKTSIGEVLWLYNFTGDPIEVSGQQFTPTGSDVSLLLADAKVMDKLHQLHADLKTVERILGDVRELAREWERHVPQRCGDYLEELQDTLAGA